MPAQITSGTLAYAFGCGKAVVSTPYWHAEELLADSRGSGSVRAIPAAIAQEICSLLRDEPRRHAMRKRAYMLGREMIWSHVAPSLHGTRSSGRGAVRIDRPSSRSRSERSTNAPGSFPDWRLDHLLRMTDSTADVPARHVHAPQFRRRILHRR